MKGWFVVQTHARAESRAAESLTEAGFEAWLPTERVWRNRSGGVRGARRVACDVPLFPGYVLVELDDEDVPGGCIERFDIGAMADGVRCLVSVGGRPAAVNARVVERLRAELDAGDHVHTKEEKRPVPLVGSRVRITGGVFKGRLADMLAHMTPEKRVRVLLDGLGGGAMSLGEDMVEAAA